MVNKEMENMLSVPDADDPNLSFQIQGCVVYLKKGSNKRNSAKLWNKGLKTQESKLSG